VIAGGGLDKLDITILEDGTIKVVIDGQVSAANHFNAEQFLVFIQTMTGGDSTHETIKQSHTHNHAHGEDHIHQ
jgi:hypothetical protein